MGGDKLLAALTSAPYIVALKDGVAEQVPPVSKISHMLKEQFPEVPDLKANPVRQFIGMAVRAILSDQGYELDETGVRISRDPVFRSGSTYRLTTEQEEDDDLLVRFVAMLNPDERRRLYDLIKAAM
ncbi:hypothetical protein [Mesorhizobium sp. B1-1-5]|uniref:hypothetical protein n=1 Tax=Mesorhizobium sp. B1-1-5 TaxID=2589979 RepID=UPI00112A5F30|nr:hypothetical protein [Mesorhizobium sp. B1-1-5]TPO05149.1 hypothetical protein FJ980_14835 [Mesorhizobium sp. B1-1-5]